VAIRYDDEESYRFHEGDKENSCFLCHDGSKDLIVVRHIESMSMVHLCGDCMVKNLADYLLDNTRPWLGDKKL